MLFSRVDIENMDQRYRIAFINSLTGFKSANLIGTVDGNGLTNLSIINSCVHLGAHPPLIGFVSRPHSVPRHSIENIVETGFYSINHVNQNILKQAHQTSARYAKDQSEFQATGLTELWVNEFSAPFVKEAVIRLGIEYRKTYHIDLNKTDLIVGEIIQVDLPGECLTKGGAVAIEKADSVLMSGLDRYHTARFLARLSYAKPDKPTEEL